MQEMKRMARFLTRSINPLVILLGVAIAVVLLKAHYYSDNSNITKGLARRTVEITY